MSQGKRVVLAVAGCIAAYTAWRLAFPAPAEPPEAQPSAGASPVADGSDEDVRAACNEGVLHACDVAAKGHHKDEIQGATPRFSSELMLRACRVGSNAGCQEVTNWNMLHRYNYVWLAMGLAWLIAYALGLRAATGSEGGPAVAGFWRRAGAVAVESITYIFVHFALSNALGDSWPPNIVLGTVFAGYPILTHRYWGQNLGKFVVGIRVTALDGSPVTWKQAVLRSSVDVVGQLAMLGVQASTFMSIGPEYLWARPQLRLAFDESVSPLHGWISAAFGAWGLGEAIVALSNSRRRALHDFIAGTIVVTSPATPAVPPVTSGPVGVGVQTP